MSEHATAPIVLVTTGDQKRPKLILVTQGSFSDDQILELSETWDVNDIRILLDLDAELTSDLAEKIAASHNHPNVERVHWRAPEPIAV